MYKLLLIEDDRLLADSVGAALSSSLYQIRRIYDGTMGLKAALNDDPDLIILDLMLPGKSGYLITRQLRNLGRETPILLISGKKDICDIVTGFDCGADGYLCKPFNLRELKARVQALLRRPPQTRQQQYQLGELVIDSESCLVLRGSKQLNLPNKQFAILKYLCMHPEKTVSKQELFNSIWDTESDSMVATIDVHMSKIRRQLQDFAGGGPEVITTIHGKGYRIRNSKQAPPSSRSRR